MIGISGPVLTSAEKDFITRNDIGGVTLFGRNVQSPEQVYRLCSEIQDLAKKQASGLPLFIAIDQEGGRVARLKSPFTVWPPVANLGRKNSTAFSENFAFAMGTELRAVGVNVDWAPCADVLTNPKNAVIGDRAVSTSAEVCAEHVAAMIQGYSRSHLISCAKHFPGHGNTLLDSHEHLPIEELTLERLRQSELLPFRSAVRADVPMIMTSHILYKTLDPQWPVTLSEAVLQNILRKELGFSGLIVSDDLGMKAMANHYSAQEIPVRAIQAGVDILLYCNEPDVPPVALASLQAALDRGEISEARLQESLDRVTVTKNKFLRQKAEVSFSEARMVIGHASNMKLAQEMAR
jgi:beta-N-acetylhexosaminidase